ncbi:hypothetical protein [Streptomyces sp. bgisy154]|uniref:hypothetical protein n=1 Tax=Streptomyces sp. bgisy154 TaxID=3413794 RepID=UPI003D711F64
MQVQFPEAQIRAKAVEIGLIGEGEDLPRSLRSRVVAALIQEAAPRFREGSAPVADTVRVQPGGSIDIDGKPFPWMVQADRIEVALEPDGSGLVRLTLPARNIQITQPADESE